MTQADRIRAYVFDEVIRAAREEGATEVTVRTGDVHKELGLKNAMPAVCSALSGMKFCQHADVAIKDRRGPKAGSNVYITYDLIATEHSRQGRKTKGQKLTPVTLQVDAAPDYSDSLVLVSCVKQKLENPAPARDLYTSPLFVGCRAIVEGCRADWFVLSALHGLVSPNMVIEPYDLTLNSMTTAERRNWASRVLAELLPIARRYGRVVFLAGVRYREFLIAPLREDGIEVVIPMEGLTLGRQLSWLARHASDDSHSRRGRSDRLTHLRQFYLLLNELAERTGGPYRLGELSTDLGIPERGLYFFFESGEIRSTSGNGLRVVRVGTHALKLNAESTLVGRLRQHRGTVNGGNHRGSVFRELVGQALQARGDIESCESWDIRGSIGKAANKLSVSKELVKEWELPIEKAVNAYLADTLFLWLDVDDAPSPDSKRALLERNSIALLSNASGTKNDMASSSWLGRFSNRERVQLSGLWNNNHVDEEYDPTFLELLGEQVKSTKRVTFGDH